MWRRESEVRSLAEHFYADLCARGSTSSWTTERAAGREIQKTPSWWVPDPAGDRRKIARKREVEIKASSRRAARGKEAQALEKIVELVSSVNSARP